VLFSLVALVALVALVVVLGAMVLAFFCCFSGKLSSDVKWFYAFLQGCPLKLK
jgi:hypothetical protein